MLSTTSAVFPDLPGMLKHVEALSGLCLCVKIFDSAICTDTLLADIPPRHKLHQSPFCMQTKQTRNRECVQCDLRDIPAKALAHATPFTNVCHAGATEVIIPWIFADRLVALGYLGQFRESDTQPHTLPLFSVVQVQRILVIAILIQGFFNQEIIRAARAGRRDGTRRGLRIHRYLRAHLRTDPGLKDLARELSLSPSRASHAVKEATGESFAALKLRLKLDSAKQMLAGTMLTIDSIAAACGFQDTRYFHRVFRKATGLPPGQWRSRRQSGIRLDA